MPEYKVLNSANNDIREKAIKNELLRFETHTKNLSDKANGIISSLKNSLHVTDDEGIAPVMEDRIEDIGVEKEFIDKDIKMLEDDVFKIQELARQSGELETQIKDIIHQLHSERDTIDDRIHKMSSPYLVPEGFVQDLEQSKMVGRPCLLEGESGVGKRAFVYAFGVEYNHNVIRMCLTNKTNPDNLFYEKTLSNEHMVLGPLGNTVIELSKWQSKEDKIKDVEKGLTVSGPIEDDPIPIVMVEGIDKVSEKTFEKIIEELEKDHISFSIGNFQEDLSSHVRPFIIIVNDNDVNQVPIHCYNQCYPIEMSFPDYELLLKIIQVHFKDISHKLANNALIKFHEIREHADVLEKPSLKELFTWMETLVEDDDGTEDVPVLLSHHLDILLKHKDDHAHFADEVQETEEEVHYSIER